MMKSSPWPGYERRLAEFHTWAPLADAAAMREMLQSLGYRGGFTDAEAEERLTSVNVREQRSALIRAGRGARGWMTNREPSS